MTMKYYEMIQLLAVHQDSAATLETPWTLNSHQGVRCLQALLQSQPVSTGMSRKNGIDLATHEC
jgi:hypothetical protein